MLCGELLSGGFVSAGAVPVVPCGVPGLWLPGCLRATSPRLLTSPYLTLLAELLAAGRLELRDDFLELMDLAKRGHQAPGGGNGAPELDLDLHADDIDENVFLGESRPFLPSKTPADAQRRRDVYFGVQRLMAKRPLERILSIQRSDQCRNGDAIENDANTPTVFLSGVLPGHNRSQPTRPNVATRDLASRRGCCARRDPLPFISKARIPP